jgi:hypothetical protein
VAYGYTLQVNGKQERCFRAEWTREQAQEELAKRLRKRDAPPAPAAPKTFGQVAEEYLTFKRGKGKRSVREDEKILAKLKTRLGGDTPLPEITAQRIAQYDRDRVSEKSKLGRFVTPDHQPRAGGPAPSAPACRGVGLRREGAADSHGAGARGPTSLLGRGRAGAAPGRV